jgi:hypothetical protein
MWAHCEPEFSSLLEIIRENWVRSAKSTNSHAFFIVGGSDARIITG